MLGDLLYARGDFAEAAECYSRAADASIAGRLNAAKALAAGNNHEAAAAALQRLLARDPNHFSALWTLGYILMFLGRFEEALPRLEKACALAPDAVGPFYNLIASSASPSPIAVARMTTLLERGRLERAARITAHYALGKAFDDLNDYGTAIRHVDAAHRLEEGLSIPYDRGQATAWVDLQIARLYVRFLPRACRARYQRRDTPFRSRHAPLRHDADRTDPVQPSACRGRRRDDVLAQARDRLGAESAEWAELDGDRRIG